jgi:hypothetical protein
VKLVALPTIFPVIPSGAVTGPKKVVVIAVVPADTKLGKVVIADCIAFTTTEACATGPITLDPAILVGV